MEDKQKRVRFMEEVVVYPMISWSFAYRQCREPTWVQYAVDRFRFQRRILVVEKEILHVFDEAHRNKVYDCISKGVNYDVVNNDKIKE